MWLRVQFERAELKLTWGNDLGPYPSTYTVALDTLKQTVDGIRAQLQRLTNWSRDSDPAGLPGIMRALAVAGSDLRYVLFEPERWNSQDPTTTIETLKTWRSQEYDRGDTRLYITADPDLHIPWGLVYEGDPQEIADAASSIEAFTGFWSLRFNLSAIFSGCTQPASSVTRSRASFRMLSVVNRYEYAFAEANLGGAGYGALNDIVNMPVGVAFTVAEADRKISEATTKDTVFHFFGHGRDGELDLGDDQHINALNFKKMLGRLTDRQQVRGAASCSVVFLNACDSALGQSDYSLRSATARPGLCGLVATEAEVPRDFAARFGLRFLTSMVREGHSIGETMGSLRHDTDLWPLSLLYGCYAALDYRIGPPPEESRGLSI